ncbi:IS1/IS1595 family N-terminal zinc-binding domain-containing protein [Metallosphaera javensis (ex Sakai et al. 2022)]
MNHVVKKGRVRGKQEYLCRNCGRQFVEGAKHHYDKSVRERALERECLE